MSWIRTVERLRAERRAGVLVTVAVVRGHAPRDAGAKMVVAVDASWGTIGGGNLEADPPRTDDDHPRLGDVDRGEPGCADPRRIAGVAGALLDDR